MLGQFISRQDIDGDLGKMVVIAGGMRSFKTGLILQYANYLKKYAKTKIQMFKPESDVRPELLNGLPDNHVVSRDGVPGIPAYLIGKDNPIEDIKRQIDPDSRVYFFEEVTLLPKPEEVALLLARLRDYGRIVVAAGLDKNFFGEPMGAMPYLMAHANHVIKIYGACEDEGCSNDGIYSQLVDGKGSPVPFSGPEINVGDSDYKLRCQNHFDWMGTDKHGDLERILKP